MLDISYPCVCGHSKINHDNAFGLSEKRGSLKFVYMCAVKYCNCDEFKADNLRYLEKKSGPKQ
jgi:hypothetical protein